jgi:hypothetical protein
MNETNFKKGDKVVCTYAPNDWFTTGKTYEVLDTCEDDILLKDDESDESWVGDPQDSFEVKNEMFFLIEDYGYNTELYGTFSSREEAEDHVKVHGREGITYRLAKADKSFEIARTLKEV